MFRSSNPLMGLLRRLPRRRAATEEPDAAPRAPDGPDASAAPTPVSPAGPVPVPAALDLPAGVDPEELARRPDVRRRSRVRRRLRFLERVRELLLRDLGGLVYEISRATGESEARRHRDELVAGKLRRLAALDEEARELRVALGLVAGDVVLREPGVGGSCPACGELFGSEARFCWNCATPVGRGAPAGQPASAGAGPAAATAHAGGSAGANSAELAAQAGPSAGASPAAATADAGTSAGAGSAEATPPAGTSDRAAEAGAGTPGARAPADAGAPGDPAAARPAEPDRPTRLLDDPVAAATPEGGTR